MAKNKKIGILLAASGSGGHIFPAIALAEELERRIDVEIIFAASNRALDKKILSGSKHEKVYFSINPMPYRASFRVFAFIVKLVYDWFLALYILVRKRPRIVVGFGGYTSGTVVFTAVLLGIKTVIHEQNAAPGRANKILDGLVTAVAVSFASSKKYFRNQNVLFTGNPIRRSVMSVKRAEAFNSLGLDKNKFTIAVIGGSQGAHNMNMVVSDAIISLEGNHLNRFQVIHITGPKDTDEVSDKYMDGNIRAKTFAFMENIQDAYNVCDLAISRAGSAAIFELAYFAKPMILMPYPSKKNSQRLNAEYFASRGAAICKEEETTKSADLRVVLDDLMSDNNRLKELSTNAKELSQPEAAALLAEEVMLRARIN